MNQHRVKLKRFLLALSVFITILFISMIATFTILYNKYDLNTAKLTSLNNGILVYSATGTDNTLYNTNRSILDIKTLPEYVKNAFVDTEDKRFYSHNGYDFKRIIKSSFVNLTTQSKTQGASTISQQLIKNALLTNEKTYSRKIKEIVLSMKMEKLFSKDDILEMYLNTIYFGANAYGLENASKTYFNKPAKDLTLNESCCLAGLIKSPAYYSPIFNYQNCIDRRNLVAKNLFNAGHITKVELTNVIDSPIELSQNNEIIDQSYEQEAIYEACRLLGISERDLINKKYKIITFKQDEIHNKVVEYNNEIINNAEKNTNSSLDSLTILANNKGYVLSYYANSKYDLHNTKRQPASTLKPFSVYLPCFKHNILSPASLILDEPINYNGFSPLNADKNYHGYVSARNALSHSLNIPAVKALDYVGVKKAKEILTSFGINITNSDLNLSLALGAVKNGVMLTDLMSAYITLANQGNYTNLHFVNKILDENDKVIYSHEDYFTNVIDAESCFLVNDILKDCAKTGTAKRLAELNLPIASKTGTASTEKGNTDLYNIAYTSEHTMLTWIADIDKIYLNNSLLSSSQPTDINKEICKYLYSKKNLKDFVKPENIIEKDYDLVELENNHILCAPNHDIERYIAKDFFKIDNQPPIINSFDRNNLFVDIDKFGATLTFDVKKYNEYNLIKQTKNEKQILKQVKEKNGTILVTDKDIFSFDEIEYYLTNDEGFVVSEIKKIRPKDYLINLFNNEFLNNKKKWLV